MATIQQLYAVNVPAAEVETGVVQILPAPPGLYVRGDQARLFALDVRVLIDLVRCKKGINASAVQTALSELEKLADFIQEHVVP